MIKERLWIIVNKWPLNQHTLCTTSLHFALYRMLIHLSFIATSGTCTYALKKYQFWCTCYRCTCINSYMYVHYGLVHSDMLHGRWAHKWVLTHIEQLSSNHLPPLTIILKSHWSQSISNVINAWIKIWPLINSVWTRSSLRGNDLGWWLALLMDRRCPLTARATNPVITLQWRPGPNTVIPYLTHTCDVMLLLNCSIVLH